MVRQQLPVLRRAVPLVVTGAAVEGVALWLLAPQIAPGPVAMAVLDGY